MIAIIRIFRESTAQAIQQLWGNKLRTFLSLLGITIGIWCVIMVLSAVDSMEASIRKSFDKLGDDVVYVSQFDWGEDPSANYWKWMRRPSPSYEDYQAIRENASSAELVSFNLFVGAKNIEYRSSSVEGAFVIAVTDQYADIFNLEFAKGRFLTQTEYRLGSPQIIIGHRVAEELFGELDPIGKRTKIMGHKCYVVGVLKESGDDLINIMKLDNCVLMSYELAKKVTSVKTGGGRRSGTVNAKAKEGIPLEQLRDEMTGVLRASRKLKPKAEDNFALNTLSIFSKALDGVFGTLRVVGLVIGIFSMLVGMFSVANIMFVSVKERTSIIGVKKALGAKNHVILLEFMTEAIFLCLIGGAMGLFLVWLMTYAVSALFGFEVFLSMKNLLIGVGVSTATGLVSGIIPAMIASRMDPVEAIRQ